MDANITTDVLIIGAGPTGLALAAQLVRWGVDFVICDKKTDVTDLSKALAVHARTLEIYDQIGLARPAVANGAVVQHAVLMHDGKDRARLDLGDIGGPLSPFPFVLIFEQSKNERLLNEYVEKAGRHVRWQTELTGLTQDDAGVQATLRTADGETQTVEARYVVGCDGAGSPTRHLLGLGFEGSTYPRIFYVADVDMAFDGAHDSVYAVFGPESFLVLFPMPGETHWRLIGPLPPHHEAALRAATDPNAVSAPDVSFADVAPQITSLMGGRRLTIDTVRWFSSYRVHTRHAEAFSRGRCFLAGDAAHVHTPVGGQGMNTGIQDAYNLAWKLALAVKGTAGDLLLDTYSTERLANARRLLQTTDRFFDVAAGETWYQRFFRDNILPGLASVAWRFDAVKEFLFPTISQIGIHYPDSPLSRHNGDHTFKVKAGDRMPYFLTDDGVGIYDRLRAPAFHLLTFGDETADAEASKWGGLLDRHALPLSPEAREVFGAHDPVAVLLRPDNHIALLAAPTLVGSDIDDYFAAVGVTA